MINWHNIEFPAFALVTDIFGSEQTKITITERKIYGPYTGRDLNGVLHEDVIKIEKVFAIPMTTHLDYSLGLNICLLDYNKETNSLTGDTWINGVEFYPTGCGTLLSQKDISNYTLIKGERVKL